MDNRAFNFVVAKAQPATLSAPGATPCSTRIFQGNGTFDGRAAISSIGMVTC